MNYCARDVKNWYDDTDLLGGEYCANSNDNTLFNMDDLSFDDYSISIGHDRSQNIKSKNMSYDRPIKNKFINRDED